MVSVIYQIVRKIYCINLLGKLTYLLVNIDMNTNIFGNLWNFFKSYTLVLVFMYGVVWFIYYKISVHRESHEVL